MEIDISEKQKSLIQDLQSQEKLCIDKYSYYENEAKADELKDLFRNIKQTEQQHYHSLSQVLGGTVPKVDSNDSAGAKYKPTASASYKDNEDAKEHDQFLCTDCITTEKYTSTAYDDDLFQFGESDMRKLLNDIQTEEQNHAEMIYKYKTANDMK